MVLCQKSLATELMKLDWAAGVDSFVDYNDTQYNSKMSSVIPKGAWRKGSQWFVLIRKHAEKIVTDSLVFPVFQNHCKVYLFLDLALPVFGQLLVVFC
jgi:hypothetical protein